MVILNIFVLLPCLNIILTFLRNEKVFEFGVSSLSLEFKLGSLEISLEAYKSAVVFWLKLMELLLNKLICFLFVPKSIETRIHNKYDASTLDIKLT